jgi:hypothetical protein
LRKGTPHAYADRYCRRARGAGGVRDSRRPHTAPAGRRYAAFLLPWLAAALFNLYLSTQHGYSVVSELPFFAIVFGLSALAGEIE